MVLSNREGLQRPYVVVTSLAGENGAATRCKMPRRMGQCIRIVLLGYLCSETRISASQSDIYTRHLGPFSVYSPSSASSRTSAQSYPRAKSNLWSSCAVSEGDLFKRAAASVDFPDDGSPRTSICFAGMDLEEETESRIDDQRFSGSESGDDGLESFMFPS